MTKLQQAFELHQKSDLNEAEKLYLQYLEDNSNSADGNNLLGLLYLQKEELSNAEKYISKALEIKKDTYFYDNLGKVYLKKHDYKSAIEVLQQGLELDSRNFSLWFDIALAYKGNSDWENSKKAYEKVLSINPNSHQAYFNLAFLRFNDNEPYEAVKCYEKALELKPDDLESKYFLSLAYMQIKDYDKGLNFFENRLCRFSAYISQEKTYPHKISEQNIWQGEDIKDKTIYTYYEAGFGDVIMFARYLPLLEKRCKKIIFKPQDALRNLMQENFPNIEVMKYFKDENEINFDIHLPFLSLPKVLGLKDEEIFIGHEGYLKANPAITEQYRKKYFNNNKFKIGIKWQGNTFYDTERVINVESFFNLMKLKNTQFYSCQTFDGSEELEKIKEKFEIIDLGKTFKDFADTTAAVENLDLVICNDTSLAHIAGAIGKPCWILLPHVYNWRWHIDLSKCDWYDSVRIFRQEKQSDWQEVFDRVEIELKKLLNS